MAQATETSSKNKPAPAPREVLDELVRSAAHGAGEQLSGMVNRLVTVLLDLTLAGDDAQDAYRRTRAGNLLKSNSYAFVHLASEALKRALEQGVDELAPAAKAGADLSSLSLVPIEVMDSKVAFGALCRPFDIEHSEVLASLCVRMGLLLGRDVLRSSQNPLRPEVFLTAIHSAWCEFEPDAGSHDLLLPLLRPDLFLDLGELLNAADQELRARNKQARERFHISKGSDARGKRSGMDATLAQQLRSLLGGGDELAIPLIPELANMPQGSGWRPSSAHGFDVAAPVPPAAPVAAQVHPAAAGQHAGQAFATGAGPAAGFGMQPGTQPGGPGFAAAAQGAGTTAYSGFAPGAPSAGVGMPGPGMANVAGAGLAGAGFMFAPGGLDLPGLPGSSAYAGAAQTGAGVPTSLLDLLASIQVAHTEQAVQAANVGGAGAEAGSINIAALAAAGGAAAGSAPSSPHQVFYLPRLKQSLPQGSLSRGEEHTLDLLSRIFETVLLDDSIPPETRELIRYLQVPVLKAALLDQDFFFEEMHPARRMIDLVSRMGWEQRQAPDDPVVQAMRRGVDKIGVPGAETQAFADAVAEVEAQLAAEERAAEEAIATPIARATRLERQNVATRSARTAVKLRLGDGELTGTVSSFLEQRWVDVLTFAYMIDDDKPGAVDNATRTMDELIWTVKPKATAEQRRALIAKLPPLLTTLNKWLDAIKWQDAERLQFFAELAECHLQIVRAPIELSPERQLELAVEAAQQDALRRIAQEQAIAAQEEPPPRDDAINTVDELERGMRLEFRERDGNVRKVKLAWVSPLRTLFIFSGAARQESFSLPAEKLVEALRCGSIRVLNVEGVVGRVLTEAMQEAVNDPAPQRAAV